MEIAGYEVPTAVVLLAGVGLLGMLALTAPELPHSRVEEVLSRGGRPGTAP